MPKTLLSSRSACARATKLIVRLEKATSQKMRRLPPAAAKRQPAKKALTIAKPLMTSSRVAPGSRESVHHVGLAGPNTVAASLAFATLVGATADTTAQLNGSAWSAVHKTNPDITSAKPGVRSSGGCA